jgi:hypothetical protein
MLRWQKGKGWKVGEAPELGATGTPESHTESGGIIAHPTEVEGPFANQRGCTHPHDSCRRGAHRSGRGDKAETPAVWSHILFLSWAGSSSVFVCVHMYVWEHVLCVCGNMCYVHVCVGACVCACMCESMCYVHVCVGVCVCACMCGSMCVCACMCRSMCMYTYVCIVQKSMLMCVCVFPCMHMPWCTCGGQWTVFGS